MTHRHGRALLGGILLVLLLAGAGGAVCSLVREPAAGLVRAVTHGGLDGVGALSLAEALSGLSAWIVIGCAAWLVTTLSLTTAAAVLTATRSCPQASRVMDRLARRTCPASAHRWVRRLVAAGCGLALGPGLAITSAGADVDRPPDRGCVADISGLVLPDRTHGRPEQRRQRQVTVRHGDSLWSIAEALGRGGSAPPETTGWQELYRANRGVVGPEPDLIFPGTHLRVPAHDRQLRKEPR